MPRFVSSAAVAIAAMVASPTTTGAAPPGQRVVGGSPADISDGYLWLVQLQIAPKRGSEIGQCGGSLVASDWVLTAAHCFESFNADRPGTVVLGTADNCHPADGFACKGATYAEIAEVICHPGYNKRTIANDVCMLRLAAPVADRFAPVGYSTDGFSPGARFGAEDVASVLGWGLLKNNGNSGPTLQKGEVRLVSNNDCHNKYGYKPSDIEPKTFCAWARGIDACSGDSGGPLFDERTKTVIGVVSWGFGCGKQKFPGVYTDVGHYGGWIAATIAGGAAGSAGANEGQNDGKCAPVLMKFGSCPSGTHKHIGSQWQCQNAGSRLEEIVTSKVRSVWQKKQPKGCFVKKGKLFFNRAGKERPMHKPRRNICIPISC